MASVKKLPAKRKSAAKAAPGKATAAKAAKARKAPKAKSATAAGSKRAARPAAKKAAARPASKRTTKRPAKAPSESLAPTGYEDSYSDASFWAKVKNYGKAAGRSVLDPAARLYYAGMDSATPAWARSTIAGALGYFISPIDAIPDITPVVGYTDDLGVLTLAVATVAAHITPEHKKKAREKLREWFG